MHGNTIDVSAMTLREAYNELYDKTQITTSTVKTDGHRLSFWERYTNDPTVAEIDDFALRNFKQAAIDDGQNPVTINTVLASVRKVFRLLGPQTTGCPQGLGLVERWPYTKPLKTVARQPKRVPLEDLTAFYQACRHATGPRKWVDPCDWWRALLVTTFFTGLRRSDLFSLEFSQFDLEKAELRFTAAKTGKPAVFPLHPSVVRHLRRIWHPQGDRRRHVFSGYSGDGCSRLYSELKGIHHASGSKTYFNLHDLRRTGASEIERVRPGMARVFLQHIPTSVTDVSYLNQSEELKEAILEMRVPTGFSIGVSMQNRQERKAIEAKQKIRPDEYLSPIKPDPDLFKFEPGCWRFMRSDWFRMTGARYRILKRLALSSGPVTVDELAAVVWKGSAKPENWRQSISSRVSEVRQRVKSCLGLSDTCDPIPCVCRLSETAWTIFFPNELFKLYQAKS